MISAIVVAAGESRRMGEVDKLSLPFRTSSILETVLQELAASKVDEIIVVLKDLKSRLAITQLSKVKCVENPNAETGLTSSIQAGVKAADRSTTFYLICLADMPLINSDDYNLLINKTLNNKDKVIFQPRDKSSRGNPVLFSHHFKAAILTLKAPDGCKPILVNNHKYVQTLSTSRPGFFTDIDTQEDYVRLLDRISKT